MTDRIEKQVEMRAPIERVWRALTDSAEFGQWFKVRIDGPFVVGEVSRGHITWPGYEHLKWEARIVAMEAPTRFAFTWHPYAVDPDVDYSAETPTRVEFHLEPIGTGTRLTVVETGFDALPAHRRPDCLRMNDSGWTTQLENIKAHVGD
jgi:uncharacterized protein YndB with AHSA1/START domain